MSESLPDATKIEFSEHETALGKLVKKQDYIGVLNYLLALKKQILSLPTSKKEITIGKFYMLILPIFKKIEQDSVELKETRKQGKKEEGEKLYEQLRKSVNDYIDLIESSEQLSLGIKVNA